MLIDVGTDGEVRGWSRYGTNLTARLGSLLAPFADVPTGTTFDGEVVSVTECDGQPVQDFASVTRALFTGHPAVAERLRFVAFDMLMVAGQDVRSRPWEERDGRLRECSRFATGFARSRRSQRRPQHTRRWSPWASRAPSLNVAAPPIDRDVTVRG